MGYVLRHFKVHRKLYNTNRKHRVRHLYDKNKKKLTQYTQMKNYTVEKEQEPHDFKRILQRRYSASKSK